MQSADFLRLMQQATASTRAGDLRAATAAIQHALAGGAVAADASDASDAIDVESRWVADPLLPPGVERPVPKPSGAQEAGDRFIQGHFRLGAAARDYKLYIPPTAGSAAGSGRPLVVMLHGCTQDPDDFAAGTRMNEAARERGMFVLYPAQSAKANPKRCWNWFKHTHQSRGRGEPALLAEMVRHITGQYPVDASRIYVAGLSAGGAMAAVLGDAYPELFAAVGVHSGLPPGAARDLPTALQAMKAGPAHGASRGLRLPTIIIHGDADTTVHPTNGQHFHAVSRDGREEIESERPPSGRGWTRRVRRAENGDAVAEFWLVHGAGHAWSGGSKAGSFTDPKGPDATAAMLRFFAEHRARGEGSAR
jgi:poly(hydroxyalkanoate) depolymerase family esterase